MKGKLLNYFRQNKKYIIASLIVVLILGGFGLNRYLNSPTTAVWRVLKALGEGDQVTFENYVQLDNVIDSFIKNDCQSCGWLGGKGNIRNQLLEIFEKDSISIKKMSGQINLENEQVSGKTALVDLILFQPVLNKSSKFPVKLKKIDNSWIITEVRSISKNLDEIEKSKREFISKKNEVIRERLNEFAKIKLENKKNYKINEDKYWYYKTSSLTYRISKTAKEQIKKLVGRIDISRGKKRLHKQYISIDDKINESGSVKKVIKLKKSYAGQELHDVPKNKVRSKFYVTKAVLASGEVIKPYKDFGEYIKSAKNNKGE